MHSAGEEKLLRSELGLGYPGCNGIAGLLGDLELDGSLGFMLHDDGARRNQISVGHIPDAKRNQIAGA